MTLLNQRPLAARVAAGVLEVRDAARCGVRDLSRAHPVWGVTCPDGRALVVKAPAADRGLDRQADDTDGTGDRAEEEERLRLRDGRPRWCAGGGRWPRRAGAGAAPAQAAVGAGAHEGRPYGFETVTRTTDRT